VLDEVRRRHVGTVGIVRRHYPDPAAHPRAAVFALAVEAAAAAGRFRSITRELLALRHYDPEDLHAAMVRASLSPEATLEAMRAGTGTERIASEVASGLSSGVTYAPALFVDGARLRGEIEPGAVLAALDAAMRTSAGHALRGPSRCSPLRRGERPGCGSPCTRLRAARRERAPARAGPTAGGRRRGHHLPAYRRGARRLTPGASAAEASIGRDKRREDTTMKRAMTGLLTLDWLRRHRGRRRRRGHGRRR
jgi:hypothetical protein